LLTIPHHQRGCYTRNELTLNFGGNVKLTCLDKVHPGCLSFINEPEAIPLFQDISRDHSANGDNVDPISAVVAQCRRPASRTRHRSMSFNGPTLGRPFRHSYCAKDSQMSVWKN